MTMASMAAMTSSTLIASAMKVGCAVEKKKVTKPALSTTATMKAAERRCVRQKMTPMPVMAR